MAHVKDKDELWTLALLEQIFQRDRQDRIELSAFQRGFGPSGNCHKAR